MALTANVWIRRTYFPWIKSGAKTLEIRVDQPGVKHVLMGTVVSWNGHQDCRTKIKRITKYPSFKLALEAEDIHKIAPGPEVTKAKILETLRQIYDEEHEKRFGVAVWELELVSDSPLLGG